MSHGGKDKARHDKTKHRARNAHKSVAAEVPQPPQASEARQAQTPPAKSRPPMRERRPEPDAKAVTLAAAAMTAQAPMSRPTLSAPRVSARMSPIPTALPTTPASPQAPMPPPGPMPGLPPIASLAPMPMEPRPPAATPSTYGPAKRRRASAFEAPPDLHAQAGRGPVHRKSPPPNHK